MSRRPFNAIASVRTLITVTAGCTSFAVQTAARQVPPQRADAVAEARRAGRPAVLFIPGAPGEASG